jgi:hypothetical protein
MPELSQYPTLSYTKYKLHKVCESSETRTEGLPVQQICKTEKRIHTYTIKNTTHREEHFRVPKT